jgi:glycine C-acetyltransferase
MLLKFLLFMLIISTFATDSYPIIKSEIIKYQDNMYSKFQDHLTKELAGIKEAGLFKNERVIVSPQGAEITISSGAEVLNFCANNYLGLSNNPQLITAAKEALDTHGYGLSSVRFICGTMDLHKTLEAKIAEFFGTEDTILYAACFDANGGVFEPLLGENDAIISDSLNHASIIDGVRLCKAQRYRYENSNMADLEEQLKLAQAQNFRLIVTDAVFSMDGNAAKLDEIYALAQKYDAMIMVDECHSAGVVGKTGRGITELHNLKGKVEIITGTLGKAFGGAIGGFTTGKKEIIDLLRQRSRPYLFSNSIPPVVAAAGIRMFEMMSETNELQDKLHANTEYFVEKMIAAGFDIKPTQSAICAVMLYDAKLSQEMAAKLLNEGIYVIGFYYPVVPKDKARIRVQISAAHEREHLDKCIAAFTKVGEELGVIKSEDSGCGCGCSCGN